MRTDCFHPGKLIDEVSLERGLEERPDCIDPKLHRDVVERVCEIYKAMKRDQTRIPEPYRVGGEWLSYIEERNFFYNSILERRLDVVSDKLRNFWRNELGSIVKEYAKYEDLVLGRRQFIEWFKYNVARNYLIWQEVFHEPIDKLDVPLVGNPWGLIIKDQLVAPKAVRFHTHAMQLTSLTKGIPHPLIAEIGGGYGGMAMYLLRINKHITYINYDLPEMLILSAYYLLLSLDDRDRRFFIYGEGRIPRGNEIKLYDVLMLPNYVLPELEDDSVDVFINTFSFSEMPWNTLSEYIKQLERTLKYYFLHNNMDRKNVINRGFERIPASLYPINRDKMRLLYKHFDLFHGHTGDYREFLYQKVGSNRC